MLSWLGIGAQRSGTTWFTDLLTRHPDVGLGRSDRKELHLFNRDIGRGGTDLVRSALAREFEGLSGRRGEFTPAYLRSLWVPGLVAEVAMPEVVVVILRDPIDRFHSALTFHASLGSSVRWRRDPGLLALRTSDAQWAGCYAPQLAAWDAHVGRDRMIVLQYEALTVDPWPAVERVWERLGVDAAVVADRTVERRPERPVAGPRLHSSLDLHLASLYGPQLAELESWGIDASLWRSLHDAAAPDR